MFYTKYRPQNFTQISRPNDAADALSKQVLSGKTSHAYLFIGPRGTGKTSTARVLSKALNCSNLKPNGDPCGECDSCLSISEGNFVDLIEIDAASNRGIDDIRDLKDKIRIAPSQGKVKIYIIDEVHMLTTEAFNALLKTLEEPPKNVVFILCTTESHKVPETIKSRCQVFKFKRASIIQIVNKLKSISKEEKIKLSVEDLEKIAKASLGGFRDAETLLEQVADGDIDIDSLFGISSKEKYLDFVGYLILKDSKSALLFIDKVFEEGIDLYMWVGELLKYLRELVFIKSGIPDEVFGVNEELLREMEIQSSKVDFIWLFDVSNTFMDFHEKIKSSFIEQLPVELAILKICYVGNGDSKKGKDTDNDNDNNGRSGGIINTGIKKDKDKDKDISDIDATLNINKQEIKKTIKEEDDNLDLNLNVSYSTDISEVESGEPIIDLKSVCDKWEEFVSKTKGLNHSITALIKSGKVERVEGKFLVLQFFYNFHKERLESPKNRSIVENLLKEIYGCDLKIKCETGGEQPKKLKKGETGDLTDKNVLIPTSLDASEIMTAFDGGLPILGNYSG